MLDTKAIFERYEQLRPRLPQVGTGPATQDIDSLLDIAEHVDAFVFDAFGVLNVGETPIKGAARRLDQLRDRGCRIRILTNAASYDRGAARAKFARLGLRVGGGEIVTSREAAIAHLDARRWGAIAAPEDGLADLPQDAIRLAEDPAGFARADGFVFLSSAGWTAARQAILAAAMRDNPRPLVIANADLAAPRGDGFSLEPGHFGHLIADELPTHVRFFGKPLAEVYEMVEATLPGVPAARIAMCGDTLHTDIIGAAARGWRTVLVTRDGLFAGFDTAEFSRRSGVFADWRLERI